MSNLIELVAINGSEREFEPKGALLNEPVLMFSTLHSPFFDILNVSLLQSSRSFEDLEDHGGKKRNMNLHRLAQGS